MRATVTNQVRPAQTWREWCITPAATGQETIAAGANSLLVTVAAGQQQEHAIYPSTMICHNGGLVLLTDYYGTARPITALAGVPYPIQATSFTGTGTTADEIVFLYNSP